VRWNSVHYEDITSEGGYGPVLYNVARDCSVWSVAGDNRRPLESHLILHGTPSARTRAQFTRGAERVHRQLACLHQGHGRVHRQGHPRRSSVRRGRQCLLPMLGPGMENAGRRWQCHHPRAAHAGRRQRTNV
jgi:hypothetical protein